jgi:ankyrin repeat protein
MCAIRADNVEVSGLLLRRGANPNAARKGGHSALIQCALDDRVEIATMLLAMGAKVNSQDDLGLTALMHCAMFGRTQTARVLLAKKAHPDLRGTTDWLKGETALTLAISGRHPEMTRLLLQSGANPNVLGPGGETPLAIANRLQKDDVVQELLKAGAR